MAYTSFLKEWYRRARNFPFSLWHSYFSTKQQKIFFVLVCVGVLLRAYNAYVTQLWKDEVSILFTSQDYSFVQLLLQKHWDTAHPPFYFIFLRYWQQVSLDPFVIRLPGVLASFVTLSFIPVLAAQIAPRMKAFPLIALILFLFSHSQISLQIVARPYPFTIMFVVISLFLFFKLLETFPYRLSKHVLASFTLINLLAFFSDYSAIWLFVSYGAYLFFTALTSLYKRELKKTFKSILFLGLSLSIPLIIVAPLMVLNYIQSIRLLSYLDITFAQAPFVALARGLVFFTSATYSDLLPRFLYGFGSITQSYLLFVFSLSSFIYLFRANRKNALFLGAMIIFPVALSFIYSLLFKPIYVDRNLFIVNIAFLLFISFGLARLYDLNKQSLVVLIVLFWVINFLSLFPGLYYVALPYNWRKIVTHLTTAQRTRNVLVMTRDLEYFSSPIEYYTELESYRRPFFIAGTKEYRDALKKTTDVRKPTIFFIERAYPEDMYDKKRQYYTHIAKELECRVKEIPMYFLYFARCEK